MKIKMRKGMAVKFAAKIAALSAMLNRGKGDTLNWSWTYGTAAGDVAIGSSSLTPGLEGTVANLIDNNTETDFVSIVASGGEYL